MYIMGESNFVLIKHNQKRSKSLLSNKSIHPDARNVFISEDREMSSYMQR